MHSLKLDESKGDTTEGTDFTVKLIRLKKEREAGEDVRLWYLLLIFMPPRGGFVGGLLPSAKEVVLGRPLILKLSRASIPASTPRLEEGSVSAASFSPAAPAASTRLGWPVLLRQLSSSSSATA